MRILVLSGDRHHPAAIVRQGLSSLGSDHYTFDWLEDPTDLSPDQLDRYSFLVFAKANHRNEGDSAPWVSETSAVRFVDYVERGGVILFLHAGTAVYDSVPNLCHLMGGSFVRHPPQCDVTVEPRASHPLTDGSSPFTLRDEHYFMAMHDPGVEQFLISRSEHGEEPAGWIRTQGDGHVCVLTPGHNLPVWLHPSYQALLRNCLDWCRVNTNTGGPQ